MCIEITTYCLSSYSAVLEKPCIKSAKARRKDQKPGDVSTQDDFEVSNQSSWRVSFTLSFSKFVVLVLLCFNVKAAEYTSIKSL